MVKKTNIFLIYFMFFSANMLFAADPLDTWTKTIIDSTGNLYSVSYGNNKFVAVGDSGSVLFAGSDGKNWTKAPSMPGNENLRGITYGGGKFVAVGVEYISEIPNARIINSSNGNDWIDVSPVYNDRLTGVAYGNGRYITVGFDGQIFISENDSSAAYGSVYTFSGITYGDSTFIAIDKYGGIEKSSDGQVWATVGVYDTFNGVTYGNGRFVAVGPSGNIFYSLDKGDNWSSVSAIGWGGLYGVAYGNTAFVAVGDTGTVVTSPEGINWTSRGSGITEILYGVTYGNNTYVAVGEKGTIIKSGLLSDPFDTTYSIKDTSPPVIDTALFGLLNNGEDSYVTVTVSDDIALAKGEFLVKKNGESDNAFDTIFAKEGLAITKLIQAIKIPKEYITPRGISYKITVTDLANNKKEVTGYLRIKVADYKLPFPTWTWRMISFPFNDVGNVFGALAGRRYYRYDGKNYMGWSGTDYINNYDSSFMNATPGKSFWYKIKEDNNNEIDTVMVNGTSVDPGNVPEISVPPGWSQIANPYFYEISCDQIKMKVGNSDTMLIYDSTKGGWLQDQFPEYAGNGQYNNLKIIKPFTGCWVNNPGYETISLIFPVFEAGITGTANRNPSHKMKNDGWGLKLKVMSNNYIDTDNYLGFMPGAENGYDFYDLSKPPPVENYVALYFLHSEWGRYNGRYRTDYRACGNFGTLEITSYDFIIETNVKDNATLSWDFINPPLNYRVILYDKKEDKKVDLSGIKDYLIDWQNGELKREFSMIIEWDNIYLFNSLEISDLNQNHIIDGEDLFLFSRTFGKTQNENNWDPKTDLNKDKIIDGSDLFILGNSFGKHY